MSEQKKKALDAALAQIDKQFGKGSIMRSREKLFLDAFSNWRRLVSAGYIFL